MRTSEEKVEELHRRMKNVKRQRMRRKMMIYSSSVLAACLCVVVSAIMTSKAMNLTNVNAKESMTASIFASEGMLGYIVIALIAFTLGIAFTCFCKKLKNMVR